MKVTDLDFSSLNCELNFAYCPTKALKMNKDNGLKILNHISSELGFFDKRAIKLLSDGLRYFYVFYSLKIKLEESHLLNFPREIVDSGGNYYFFKLFAKVGDQIVECQPENGFAGEDVLLSVISEVDSLFENSNHDKYVFDTFSLDIVGSPIFITKMIDEWTETNLDKFHNSYFMDKEAVDSLVSIIEYGKTKNKKNEHETKSRTRKTKKKTTKKEL